MEKTVFRLGNLAPSDNMVQRATLAFWLPPAGL